MKFNMMNAFGRAFTIFFVSSGTFYALNGENLVGFCLLLLGVFACLIDTAEDNYK